MKAQAPDQAGIAGDTQARLARTRWSIVLAAREHDSPHAEAALARLCEIYWYPIYAFLRCKGHSKHEAEDLTQGLFEHLLEDDALRAVTPDKGRFRTFLKAAVTNYLHNERLRRHARKRGGRRVVAWDELDAEERYRREPIDGQTPDKVFERRWATATVEQVQARLRQEYAALGKATLYEQLKPFLTEEPRPGVYTSLSASLQTTEGALKVSLHRLRRTTVFKSRATATPKWPFSRWTPASCWKNSPPCLSLFGATPTAPASATSAPWPRISPPPSVWARTTNTSPRWMPMAWLSPRSRASTNWCRKRIPESATLEKCLDALERLVEFRLNPGQAAAK